MIDVRMEELLVVAVGGAMVMIAVLRWISWLRDKRHSSRAKRNTLYCPVCVCYFEDRSSEKLPECPGCKRPIQRGRDRSLG